MGKLLKFGFVLLIFCTLATGGSLIFARQQPSPDYLAALHFADCTVPCWIGIEPGQTTIEQARQRLTDVFTDSPVFDLEFTSATSLGTVWLKLQDRLDPHAAVEILIYSDRGLVTSIQFNLFSGTLFASGGNYANLPAAKAVSVAQLHRIFGAPRRMVVPNLTLNRLDFLALLYGDDDEGMLAHVMDLDPNAPVLSMVFFGNWGILAAEGNATRQIQRWQGFVSPNRYVDLMMKAIQ